MEELIDRRLQREVPWTMRELYVLDRAAFDDRPQELDALPPVPEASGIHLVRIEPLGDPWSPGGGGLNG